MSSYIYLNDFLIWLTINGSFLLLYFSFCLATSNTHLIFNEFGKNLIFNKNWRVYAKSYSIKN